MRPRKLFATLLAGALGVAGLAFAPPASAATLTVCSHGCDHTAIQAAIDAAADNDTIQIGAGLYKENLSITKPITLDAEPHPGKVTLRPASGAAITVNTSGTVNIYDFEIEGPGGPAANTGIVVESGTVELARNTFGTATNPLHTGVRIRGGSVSTLADQTTPPVDNSNTFGPSHHHMVDETATGMDIIDELNRNEFPHGATSTPTADGSGHTTRTVFSSIDQAKTSTGVEKIAVEDGTYDEDVTLSADVAMVRRDASGARPIINGQVTITASSDGVNLSGFEVRATSDATGHRPAVLVNEGAQNTTIDDNKLVALDQSTALEAKPGQSNLQITDNVVAAPTGRAARLIDVQSVSGKVSQGVTIENNSFSGSSEIAVRLDARASQIKANTLQANIAEVAAIDILANKVTVTGLVLDDVANGPDEQAAIRVAAGVTDTLIEGGEITGNRIGVLFGSGTDNAVQKVKFGGNDFAAVNKHAFDMLLAEGNWWGHASGPQAVMNPLGTGDAVGGTVDYLPWCVDDACTGADEASSVL